jgi:hypothetical protein
MDASDHILNATWFRDKNKLYCLENGMTKGRRDNSGFVTRQKGEELSMPHLKQLFMICTLNLLGE